MATPNFQVKAISKEAAQVRLIVWLVNSDVDYFPENEAFGLQLLWDALPVKQRSSYPLANITEAQISDFAWLQAHATEFVDQFSYAAFKHFPVAKKVESLDEKMYQAFWADLAKVPRAEIEMTLTDPKWAAHIAPDMAWQSFATDAG